MPAPQLPRDLLQVFASLKSPEDVDRLLTDLLTPSEIDSLGERWALVKLLASGCSQRATRDALGVSVTTVSRGSRQLKYGQGGFALAFQVLELFDTGEASDAHFTGAGEPS